VSVVLREDRSVDFAAAGLGLQYGTVRLVKSEPSWVSLGLDLAVKTERALGELVEAIEHVGSTAVPGLIAKPVIDLALGVRPGVDVGELVDPITAAGWIYRGDAGEDGGWVFVLEDSPWHRVAHAHGVVFGDEPWQRYLLFRDLLRRDGAARTAYAEAKRQLAEQHRNDATSYTKGKTTAVEELLTSIG
jgi:GrpB-like predicted nucleotidyltransferase (UPF0157 family)